MNYNEAVKILQMSNIEHITEINIKKQYRILALKYHPDKNHDEDSLKIFQEINESYNYLLKYVNIDHYESDLEDEKEYDEMNSFDYCSQPIDKNSYSYHLFTFIKNVLSNEMQDSTQNDTQHPLFNLGNKILFKILQKIETKCEDKMFSILEKIDKNTLLKLKILLIKHKESLHIQDSFFDRLDNIIEEKINKDDCIILTPSIDDIIENNIYKFTLNSKLYLVPLWHHELVYDNSGSDLYIKCIPILQDNISIDNENNIHIHLKYNIIELFDITYKEFNIGSKKCKFSINDVKLKNTQIIRLGKCGISKINTTSLYETTNISDIFVHLELVL
jgi:curved DNA-binding protein CbpA